MVLLVSLIPTDAAEVWDVRYVCECGQSAMLRRNFSDSVRCLTCWETPQTVDSLVNISPVIKAVQ